MSVTATDAWRQPRTSRGRKISRAAGALPVRYDQVDHHGVVTLRYDSRLHHIGLGARHRGTPIVLLVADRDVRIVTEDGALLRELILDPSRDYQRQSA
ncbi:MAG TPA: hypothetical protein VGS17_11940 [Candidatus Limnocylindria bacterium]|nr:hypothetical protein [Candidatus Limnocylindria bacterium]